MLRAAFRPFLFGVAALLLAWLGQRSLRDNHLFDAAVLFSAAVLLFVWALGGRAYAPETPWPFPRAPLAWRSPQLAAAGGLLLAAAGLAALAWQNFDYATPETTAQAWLQHVGSVTLALLAAFIAGFGEWWQLPTAQGMVMPWRRQRVHSALRRQSAPPAPQRPRLASFNHATSPNDAWRAGGVSRMLLGPILLGLLLLLALALRLYRLDSLPFGTWYDEAEYGLQAMRILQDPTYRPVFEGAINGPAHYLYLVALSFQWFGVSTQSIRLVNVLFGVGAVLAGYGVGRELFGRRVGLVLAALLAASSWLITLSRLGMHSTSTTPFFTLATLWLLLRAQRTGRLFDYSLAGLLLGLGLCFYTSFRLFVPVVAIFLAHSAWHEWRCTWHLPRLRFWLGLAMLAVTALLVTAPLIWFARTHPDLFWERVQDTFIFIGKSDAERLPALLANIQKHLLMFNWRGDPNGRHNLPGAPMLDDFCGALFVLGLAYALRRLREPRFALLPLWLGITLLGGILSLDFEAPQSLRANGALGAAYVLAVVPLAVLACAWRQSAREVARWVWWPVGALLALILAANVYTYFWLQANDFSTWAVHSAAETMTAHMLSDLDASGHNDVDAFITSYYYGHPTLRFLLPISRPLHRLETTDELPLDVTPGHGALLVMNPESHALFDKARLIYPNARFEEIKPPMTGPTVLYVVHLSPADIESLQGLDGAVYANANWQGQPALRTRDRTLDLDWATAPPAPAPFSVEWRGVLHAADDGLYQLGVQAPAQVEVAIGEQAVLSGTGALTTTLHLAEGNHALRVRAVGGAGRVQLAWQPPGGEWQTIPPSALYAAPLTANGLLARYFANGAWQGPETTARIEDQLDYYVHHPPLARPYTVEYSGKIAIPAPGSYSFGLNAVDDAELWIDGRSIVKTTQPDAYAAGSVTLEPGLHDLRIRFGDRTSHTRLSVYWTPPGGVQAVIPSAVLFPPQAAYNDVTLPSAESVIRLAAPVGPTTSAAKGNVAPLLEGAATVFASGLQQPLGIGVAGDGRVYVAEAGSGKVRVYASDGRQLGLLPLDAATLGEPSDVGVDSTQITVLDAATGRVRRFGLDGSDQPDVAMDQKRIALSRGLGLGADGRVWVASTARSVIEGSAGAGEAASPVTLALPPGAQPTDVAMGKGGVLFVADPVRSLLERYSPDGALEQSWPLAVANTVESPHLAVGATGRLYVTDPEAGRVEQRDPDGNLLGVWDVPALLGQRIKAVGIAVTANGTIWITDSAGGNVVVVQP